MNFQVLTIAKTDTKVNETNVVFRMLVPYIYRSLFFRKNGFFLSSYDFFFVFCLFLSVCDVYKYC